MTEIPGLSHHACRGSVQRMILLAEAVPSRHKGLLTFLRLFWHQDTPKDVPPLLVEAVRKTLLAEGVAHSLKAYALTLPSLGTLAEEMDVVDPDGLIASYKNVKRGIASILKEDLIKVCVCVRDRFHAKTYRCLLLGFLLLR